MEHRKKISYPKSFVKDSFTFEELQIDTFSKSYREWIDDELKGRYHAIVNWVDDGFEIVAHSHRDLLKCFVFIGFAHGQAYNGR